MENKMEATIVTIVFRVSGLGEKVRNGKEHGNYYSI